MFENKWKERCLELEEILKNNEKAWIEATKSNNSTHIVKLVPECSSQFELDGEFVVDSEKATYKAHTLTLSEMVLFKAGKETASRGFREREYDYKRQLEEYESKFQLLVNKSDQAEKFSETVREQSLQTVKEMSTLLAKLQKDISDLKEELALKENEAVNLKGLYQEKLQEKEDEINYLKSAKSMITEDLSGVSTPWGCIV